MELAGAYVYFHSFTLQKAEEQYLTWCLGLPTIDGKTALGASSPANPALHIPLPLSITRAATSSSDILSAVTK